MNTGVTTIMRRDSETIIPIVKSLVGDCEHETKVTRINNRWHCRVFVNGEVNQEVVVDRRSDIGTAIREMLRIEDKCGNISAMASASRERQLKGNS